MRTKRTISILLMSAVMALTFTACGSDSSQAPTGDNAASAIQEVSMVPAETISIATGLYSDQEWSEEHNICVARVSSPIVSLTEESAKTYPKLSGALTELSSQKKEVQLEEYSDSIMDAQLHLSENPETFVTYETTESVTVRRSDTKVVSLLFKGRSCLTGAPGTDYYLSENYNPLSGKVLQLTDVITDISQLSGLVEEKLKQYYNPEQFSDALNLSSYFSGSNITWTLDYNGITFYFNPTELTPYDSLSHTVTLSFAEYPDLFREAYKLVPESGYTTELLCNEPLYMDFNNDGILDKLSLTGELSDGIYEKQTIYINDQPYSDTIHAYNLHPVLVHASTGQNYLYIEYLEDNDYKQIGIYSLENAVATRTETLQAGFHILNTQDDDTLPSEQVLTNPEDFLLDVRTETLSTISGYISCHLDENGFLEHTSDFYQFTQPISLTLQTSLTVDIIDEATGMITEQVTLDAGTQVSYYRTDNQQYADILLPDGRTGRLTVSLQNGGHYIGDTPVEKLFDGLIFAG